MITRGRVSRARTAPRCRSPRTSASSGTRGRRRTSRTTSSSSWSTTTERRGVFGGGLPRAHDASTSSCRSSRARRSGSGCTNPDGPAAALVAIDPSDGQRARDGRRRELPREPVQPRRAGRAPAGLGVQAVRARRPRSRAGSPRATTFESQPMLDLPRRQVLVGLELRGRLPRQRSTSTTATVHSDNSVYAQLTQIVGPTGRREDGATARRHEPARPATSRSGSARRRSTRSRWRARSRRSPNDG